MSSRTRVPDPRDALRSVRTRTGGTTFGQHSTRRRNRIRGVALRTVADAARCVRRLLPRSVEPNVAALRRPEPARKVSERQRAVRRRHYGGGLVHVVQGAADRRDHIGRVHRVLRGSGIRRVRKWFGHVLRVSDQGGRPLQRSSRPSATADLQAGRHCRPVGSGRCRRRARSGGSAGSRGR